MKEPSRTDWARLAAFIDGEGTILINNRMDRANGGFYLRVMVTNTDPRLARWLKETFGGSIAVARHRAKVNHRLQIKWYAACGVGLRVLKGCMPYFILKADQAQVAIDFQATIGGPGRKITKEVYEKRVSLRNQLFYLRWGQAPLDGIHKEMPREEFEKIQSDKAMLLN